ncbi:uncharacterized protein LOC119995560 [Tripterygium wilfordii]|uniref:uncharacterized protein LOC119995560 n=1 Tax=Tripterygium wilfordii TaxID=458696 RepID=UPI0018F8516C|nr:uncharacterized protein LOC119995560 [Tripterygium wilfordii]
MAEENLSLRTLREYTTPTATQSASQRPTLNIQTFEIRRNTIQLLLRLFPFSLKDKAKTWLYSEPTNSIRTWDDLKTRFLAKYFPPAKTARVRQEILTFNQYDKEPLYEAWERFKELLRKCLHHEIPDRTLVDAASGGALMGKNHREAWDLLETMATNNYQWPSKRINPKPAPVFELDAMAMLTAQISSLTKKVDSLSVNSTNSPTNTCDFCAGPHSISECTITMEQASQIGNFNRQRNDPYSNTYNPGWRNHPNFSWSNNQNVQRPPPGYAPQENKVNLALTQLTTVSTQFMAETKTNFQNQQASIRNLEIQVAQIAEAFSGRDRGSLPSQTEINPKNQEQAKAISLRRGKQVKTAVDLDAEKDDQRVESDIGNNTPAPTEESVDTTVRKATVPIPTYVPPIPFPQRLQKKNDDEKFSKFLSMFRKLEINIPFANTLEQMPKYAKFMKDILSKKRKFGHHEKIQLNEECSAILQRKLPPKLSDRGSFKIPYVIGTQLFQRALCDLGASINLLPLSVAKILGIGDIKATTVSLQMADRSITYPEGIIEDVLVRVGKLIFPADFLVLDMEGDSDTQLILGRPFLLTARTLIDVEQ